VTPPHLGAGVAEVLANGRYLDIADAGHKDMFSDPTR
jgi:hypothetical protein